MQANQVMQSFLVVPWVPEGFSRVRDLTETENRARKVSGTQGIVVVVA